MAVVTSRMPGLNLAAREDVPVEPQPMARKEPPCGSAKGRAAGDLTATILGNLARHGEPPAVVSGKPGRPGVCLDAQARCLYGTRAG